MNPETTELLEAIDEMEREGYICSVDDYDEQHELWLISWQDAAGRDCGFWGTRRVIEQAFQKAVIH